MRPLAPVLALAVLMAGAARAETPLRHYPAGGACPPVLILSHGFGGSEAGLAELARDAAAAGYDTWVMGHRETGRAALRAVLAAEDRRAALAAAVADPAANRARAADLDAALAHVLGVAGCAPPRLVLGGHSMGAQTAIIEAGARNAMGIEGKRRFDAYVALSPQGLGDRFRDGAWAEISAPVLMVTGTRDRAVEGGWHLRLAAFAGLPSDGTKHLAVVAGATHRQVSGRGPGDIPVKVRGIVVDFLAGLGSGDIRMTLREGVEFQRK
ncbi:MAG: hypothetical protein ACU0DK_07575 [Pseudooceanicola sp.]